MASSTGQQRLGQPRRGPVGLVADLLLDALAVVLEVGLDALGDVLVLVALGGQLADLGGDLRGQLVLGLLGGCAVARPRRRSPSGGGPSSVAVRPRRPRRGRPGATS